MMPTEKVSMKIDIAARQIAESTDAELLARHGELMLRRSWFWVYGARRERRQWDELYDIGMALRHRQQQCGSVA